MIPPTDATRRALLLSAPICAATWLEEPTADPRFATLVLSRHAEKGDDDARDPSLSAAGHERATRLAATFARVSKPRLFATEYRRTQQTLEPLARAARVEVVVKPAADVDAWIATLREGREGVTIVATHSNVVPRLAAAFGVTLADLDAKGNLPEAEYGRVVVLTLRFASERVDAVNSIELSI
ncbi:MAG: histidine phosphatase family protein [Planctomycetes bacterium]|nr:histidine phosphatase family protein [Planctomycetota bacterium]MCC7173484.1 histidine phosphatase family protein [Planctomycetota bacterium]